MKINITLDVTPEEARQFFGLPDVQGLQEEMLKQAQQRLAESGNQAFADMLSTAVQPMLAWQNWLQQMMADTASSERKQEE